MILVEFGRTDSNSFTRPTSNKRTEDYITGQVRVIRAPFPIVFRTMTLYFAFRRTHPPAASWNATYEKGMIDSQTALARALDKIEESVYRSVQARDGTARAPDQVLAIENRDINLSKEIRHLDHEIDQLEVESRRGVPENPGPPSARGRQTCVLSMAVLKINDNLESVSATWR